MPRGTPEIDSERCKGCELCIGACPEQILKLSETFNRRGVYYAACFAPERCTGCKMCAILCPDSAIRIWRKAG